VADVAEVALLEEEEVGCRCLLRCCIDDDAGALVIPRRRGTELDAMVTSSSLSPSFGFGYGISSRVCGSLLSGTPASKDPKDPS
jgi:hypothetical protein